jgi:hypothetical protein
VAVIGERASSAPFGRLDALAAAGAAVGLALIAGGALALRPEHAALLAIRDDGEVARALAASAAPPADEGAAFERVRRAFEGAVAARMGDLAPALERRAAAAKEALPALRAWGEVKVEWARALAREGLSPERYCDLARRAGPTLAERTLLFAGRLR